MQYTENYEKNFADDGDRAPINDELWEGGWREIVGGVNGYPTSAQFNEVCGRPDRKANELKKNKLDSDGDAKDLKITFSQASKRENIESGEKVSESLGKIAKWYSDFKDGAWAEIANDDNTTVAGKVADARIVKTHGDEIDQHRQHSKGHGKKREKAGIIGGEQISHRAQQLLQGGGNSGKPQSLQGLPARPFIPLRRQDEAKNQGAHHRQVEQDT